MYRVERYTSEHKSIWDEFVHRAKNSTFLHNRDFIEYHGDRFDDHSLLVFEGDSLISVFPANEFHKMIYSHQGLTYGGLLIQRSTKLIDVLNSLKAILKYYNDQRIEWVQLRTIPSVYREDHSDEMSYLLFQTEAQLLRCDVLAVVKPAGVDYSRDRKSGIKRGEKNNLHIKEDEDLTQFWNELLIPMLKEKHKTKPVHSLEEILDLKSKFPEKIRQFNVFHNDKLVAGTTIFETTMVARSQYIASDDSKNNLGSLDWLHHKLLSDVFVEKPFFDFGASNLESGQKINEGLLYWKEGFGSRVIPHRFYTISTANYKKLNDIFV